MDLLQYIKDNELSEGLQWLNEPKKWSFIGQGVEVYAPASANFFNDPENDSIDSSAPFLYTTVKGDFEVTTRIHIKMTHMFDSGCIMVMSDVSNWAKLCYENWLNEPSIVSVVTRGMSDDCPSLRIGEVKPYLKVLRSGNCFGFFYSLDSIKWTLIRFFTMEVPEEVKVGIVAQCPSGDECRMLFETFDLEVKKIKSAKFI